MNGKLMMQSIEARHDLAVEFVCRRNCSIGPRSMLAVFAGLAGVSFGFGAIFAACGAWMILPFAGIEMLAVAVAFLICGRRTGDFERIRVLPHLVTVERVQGASTELHKFNPRWTRLRIVRGAQAVRVLLLQAGRELEIGEHLGLQRRMAFAASFETAFRDAGRA